jgi:hypothetical protein
MAGEAPERRHLGRGQEAPLPGFQPLQGDRADGGAGETGDRITDRLQHPAHLLVTAFLDLDFDPGRLPAAIRARDAHARRERPLPEQRDAGPQLLDRFAVRDAAHVRHVPLRHLVTGVRHRQRELAVVGEHQQPFGLGVQPAYGMDAVHGGIVAAEALFQRRDNQLHHRVGGVGILAGGNDAFRLVQENVKELDVP